MFGFVNKVLVSAMIFCGCNLSNLNPFFFLSIYFVFLIFLKKNIQKINSQMLQTLKYNKTYIKYVNKHNIFHPPPSSL